MDYGKIISLIISLLSPTNASAAATIIKTLVSAIGTILDDLKTPASTMDVAWLQRAVKKLGFDPGPLDGRYGAMTRAAVAEYQKARGLTVDGWVGAQTQAWLQQEAGDA